MRYNKSNKFKYIEIMCDVLYNERRGEEYEKHQNR